MKAVFLGGKDASRPNNWKYIAGPLRVENDSAAEVETEDNDRSSQPNVLQPVLQTSVNYKRHDFTKYSCYVQSDECGSANVTWPIADDRLLVHVNGASNFAAPTTLSHFYLPTTTST